MIFALTTYKESAEMVDFVISSLKTHYPDSPILVFDDLKSRLKLPVFRGAWTERFLKAFLETDHDVCIKLDPDTIVNGRASIPTGDIFGVRRWQDKISGAAVGFSRLCAQRIVDSGFMHDEKYASHWYQYPRFRPPYLRPWETEVVEWVSLQDDIVTDVTERLGIPLTPWLDVSLTDPAAPFYHKP